MGKDQELLEAARNGNLPVVEKILGQRAKRSGPLASLRRGPGANVQDASGYSALHHAALNGHKEIVKLLLTHEASPNIVDDKGCSPLHLAAWTGNVNIVRLLLCHGPSVPNVNLMNKDKETALHCSAQYGHTAVVSLLLEHGCDPTIRNIKQESALDLAAQYGRLETVETLVRTHPELVAAYNGRSAGGIMSIPHTPLHLASRNGHKGVVEILLSSGLDVNVRTTSGTALHEAALCGKLEVVRTLLDNGADLSIRDASNNTVYDLLKQFPPHVVQDITTLIRRHRQESCYEGEDPLPPIPVPSLGSPYENVRFPGRHNSPSSSPTHWPLDHRRISQASAISQDSEGVYRCVDNRHHQWINSCGLSKSMMEGSFLSEDSCCSHGRDLDQISISSTSSIGGPTSRDRRSADIYLPMTPSPGSNNKVSPTPPKKPPRRNLSVSPTHLTPSSMGAYEYLFLARSGVRSHSDLDDINVGSKPHREMLRRGKSADQYVDMKLRYSIMGEEFSTEDDPKYQPIAITSVYENVPFRMTNPKRKLRRLQTDKSYENYDPSVILSRGDLPFKRVETSSAPNMDHMEIVKAIPGGFAPGFVQNNDRYGEKINGTYLPNCPLSPTNYQQPPTPDHPPPSASQAEMSIHERIRPLSQEYSSLMKRRSRDIETETEEELLLLVYPCQQSMMVTDQGVEEYVSDVPFADYQNGGTNTEVDIGGHGKYWGLFKGSISMETRAERPKTLRKLKNVYENAYSLPTTSYSSDETTLDDGKSPGATGVTSEKSGVGGGVLSPFDEQEEWAKISEIMASFGTGLVRESVFVSELEKEFQARLGLLNLGETNSVDPLATSIGKWLASINLPQYEQAFINFGYDNLDFLNGILNDSDLKEMGVKSEEDRNKILENINELNCKIKEVRVPPVNNNNNNSNSSNNNNNNNNEAKESTEELTSIENWLEALDLRGYADTFRKHLYTEMERVRSIWEVELTAVLEITKPGHRHRMMASLPDNGTQPTIQDINQELSHLKHSMQELETKSSRTSTPSTGTAPGPGGTSAGAGTVVSGTGTLRHSHKKNRPAPPPPTQEGQGAPQPELEIRDPSSLLVGVPSTLTATWRHRPHALLSGHLTYHARYLGSTVVHEMQGDQSTKKSIQRLRKPASEQSSARDIYLAISYRGVKFLCGDTRELVCEHEIRNIHCACQDAEDLTHFAYITKDHSSKSHYCHVFSVQNLVQATEIILTLGQAFEVAYQMALRESSAKGNGHTRSHSANLAPITSQPNHNRSHSINEIKINGHTTATSPTLVAEDV